MIEKNFTFAACRYLKRYVGVATATIAANEAALNLATGVVAKSDSLDPWALMARIYGIRVNGITTDEVRAAASQLHIVSIYAAFDQFVQAVHREWYELTDQEWRKYDGDGPFDEFGRNAPDQSLLEDYVPSSLRDCLDHYRYVRNAVAHPAADAVAQSKNFYSKQQTVLRSVGSSYGMRTAPHDLAAIDFHDAKLLARLAIDISRRVSNAFDPGDAAIAKAIPVRLRTNRRGTPERRRNKVESYLRTMYGISANRATRVYEVL